MLDDKKIEEAARLDDKEYYDRLSDNDKCFFEYGFRRGYNRALKGLLHPASDVPRNDNGMVLAFSKEIGHRKLYDMNAMLDETDCYTYQDMWENEVNKYCLTNWIFVEELFDMIMKGGKKKRMKKNKHSLKISRSYGNITLDGYPIATYSNDELKILKNLLTQVLGEVNEYIKD